MKTLATTKSFNDLYLDSKTNSIAVHTGKLAYADIIDAAIRTVRGEMQLDVDGGIPYMETIFTNQNKTGIWKAEVEAKINSFSFVTSINAFDHWVDNDSHVIHYKISITTDDGEVTISK